MPCDKSQASDFGFGYFPELEKCGAVLPHVAGAGQRQPSAGSMQPRDHTLQSAKLEGSWPCPHIKRTGAEEEGKQNLEIFDP